MKNMTTKNHGKKLIALAAVLVLALGLAAGAFAETVRAKPVTIDMEHLENRMVKTDIVYKEGNIMTLTLYVPERFDAGDIRGVKPGDVIETDGEAVTVESVEADGPDLYFNRGTAAEMLFCDAGSDEFEHVMENDFVPWIRIGSMDMEVLEYYPILDMIDPITGEVLDEYTVYRGDRLLELLQDPEAIGFSSKNVDVVYDRNNQPVMMMRQYSPAQ